MIVLNLFIYFCFILETYHPADPGRASLGLNFFVSAVSFSLFLASNRDCGTVSRRVPSLDDNAVSDILPFGTLCNLQFL